MDLNINLADINKLDLKDIANAPMPVKAVLLVLLLAGILVAGWFFVWSASVDALSAARAQEDALIQTYAAKKREAYHYEAYKTQLKEIEQSLMSMLRQLPDKSEIDALLTDINQVGVGRGLEFDLFRPGDESLSELYATMPVAIKINGGFHDLASFVSDLARLPRIVTLHEIALLPAAKGGNLTLDARIQTYRYLDADELAAQQQKAQEKK